jgi:predicted ATPase/DNA-binding SARP family transcriptional activator
MDRLLFRLLGPTGVASAGADLAVHGTLRRRLLARLLLARGAPVPVERLRDELWDGHPPASAASTLKSHVSLLRRTLGPGRIESATGSYVLHLQPGELDLDTFEAEAYMGAELLAAGDAPRAAAVLQRALSLWRGEALAEIADTAWAQGEAVRMEEMRAAALEWWFDARLSIGETHEVVPDAEAAVALHPLREQLWAKLMTALYRCGRQADALRAYQRLRTVLAEEMGIDPSPELAALEASVLAQDGAIERPPPANTMARSQVSGNLPSEVTSFVDRPRELADIEGWLQSPCLLTLTGPGGTGKTRLAIEAARRAAAGLDGVWLCELGSVTEPVEVARELGMALGCADQAGADLVDLISRRLAVGHQLLILDNCEHLIETCSHLALRLRRHAGSLRVLATSRVPLEAEGEVVYRVPSMEIPPPDEGIADLAGYESVRLFMERAARQSPGFSLDPDNTDSVAGICRRLDGVPLAIELAAARLRTMSAADIERRLDDRFALLDRGPRTAPPRQRSLRALIDWSYELLTERERELLSRLAVFPESFDLDAATAVADDLDDSASDLLGSLVDKSLVHLDPPGGVARYRMLETIREYATGRSTPESDLAARRAHAQHFSDLAIRAVPNFTGPDHLAWRTRLEHDDVNLRAAFHITLSEGSAIAMLRFAAALCRYWSSRGSYGDEMALIQTCLDLPDTQAPTPERGDAIAAAAFMLFKRGETARAQLRVQQALAIAGLLDLPDLAADALRTGAWVADRRGEAERAVSLASQALEMALRSGNNHLIARAYDIRAAAIQVIDPESAQSDYGESLSYCRLAGDTVGQASTLNNLGVLELERGNHRAARSYFYEALQIADGLGDPALVPFVRYGVGLTTLLEGDPQGATEALLEALLEARRTGQRPLEAYALLATGVARAVRQPDRTAAQLIGASQVMFGLIGEQPEPTEAALLQHALTLLSSALGAEADGLLASGGRLPEDEVILLASSPCPDTTAVVQ